MQAMPREMSLAGIKPCFLCLLLSSARDAMEISKSMEKSVLQRQLAPLKPSMARTSFRMLLRTRRLSRIPVLLVVALALFPALSPARQVQSHPADLSTPCRVADQEKYRWPSPFAGSLPAWWGHRPAPWPEVSPASCLNCLLWLPDPPAASLQTPADRESMAFNRARCFQALDMQDEALRTYWRILKGTADQETRTACTNHVLEILFDYGSLEAVMETYRNLPPDERERVSPEALVRVAQSCYLSNRDREAEPLLQEIPRESAVYPYALYQQAQAAFRKGDTGRALISLGEVVEMPADRPVPGMLREICLLTRARLLFQSGNYAEAADGFRRLSGSRLFLPDAMMGLGWCYEALDQPARAISYFLTLNQDTWADAETWAKANLETARLYSRCGMQEKAFSIFQEVQQYLEDLIARTRKSGQAPELLDNLASQLLGEPPDPGDRSASNRAGARGRDTKTEMELFLQRESHTSERLKRSLVVSDLLRQAETRLAGWKDQTQRGRDRDSLFQYPPMNPPLPCLDAEAVRLLDVSLALLDGELRLDRTEDVPDPGLPEKNREARTGRLAFYRDFYLEMFSLRPQGKEPGEILAGMQSMIRNLPFPLETRRQLLSKILFLRENLEDLKETLARSESVMEASTSRATELPRTIELRQWLNLVRTLVEFRSWADRPPASLLLSSLAPTQTPVAAAQGKRVASERLAGRIGEVRQRLHAVLREQIGWILEERRQGLEGVFVRSQLYHAEALLYRQDELLEAIQASPPE